MCGIAGIFDLNGEPLGGESAFVSEMSSTLVHRGPDDSGEFTEGPVAFGFRRLSIIDLESGHQPISNDSKTIWAMLNGEIYNFVELRQQLEGFGYHFRTKSDTEVVVYAYEHFGLRFVDHLRGMFSLAIWDSARRRFVLARDRVGKKPLYYAVRGKHLAFASEIKALLRWPRLEPSIDPTALDQYLALLYVPSPKSILKGVQKLPAGHILVANCNKGDFKVERYWQVTPTPDYSKSFEDHVDRLREVLTEAVEIRLRSDVPLGAFLSGGIDSTIVVGLMARALPNTQTFSIAFTDPRFDESSYARLAAEYLGTTHYDETVDSNNIGPDDLTKLVWFMDEPFADSSFIPTYWVSHIARKKVTVALSGDGGDELFGGYTRYRHFKTLERLQSLPTALKVTGSAVASGLHKFSARLSPTTSEQFRLAGKAFQLSTLSSNDQIKALQTYFDLADRKQIYQSDWRGALNGHSNGLPKTNGRFDGIRPADLGLVKFMTTDFETGMIDDGLVKVDRASMACSLEVRSPFLDHKVIECAMKIPPQFKLQNGQQKIVLKKAFSDLLPPTIATRGKQGFEVPFGQWFQKREWSDLLVDMLSPQRLRNQNIFDPYSVVTLRDQFLKDPDARRSSISAYQLRHRVWALLMFQMWQQQFVN